jgi:hypothetical protein
MLTHPTVEQLHQLGLAGMARAFAEFETNPTSAALSHAEWLALLLDREATNATSVACAAGCALPGCAIRPPSRTSTTVPPAVSTALCSRH